MNKPKCECTDLAKDMNPFMIDYTIIKEFNYSSIIECTKCRRRYNIELDVIGVSEIVKGEMK